MAAVRELLALADVVTITAGFSAAEQARAGEAADRRLGLSLQVTGYSPPQALASA